MLSLSPRHANRVLLLLCAFHLLVITSSNYLVQLPIEVFGFNTTWGAFSFPFIFLATDLTVRIFGSIMARKIIFCAMIPALVLSILISSLFFKGEWQGVMAISQVNTMVLRIAIASFAAYLLGQLLDITIFSHLRRISNWWVAPGISMFLSNISDTFSFFFIAFYHSTDAFMAAHWVEIALVDYCYKTLICLIFFLPAYGVLLHTLLSKMVKASTLAPIKRVNTY